MNTLKYKLFALTTGAFLGGALIFAPITNPSARADDDEWEDRWEDYHEELEEQREEAEERWEERQERIAKLRKKGFLVPYGHWHERYVPNDEYRVYHHPGVAHYEYYDAPTHDGYVIPPPNRYAAYPPVYHYRYYGTPRIGYYDFGRGGAVRVGPIQVFWD
jgi:hypothetical protein